MKQPIQLLKLQKKEVKTKVILNSGQSPTINEIKLLQLITKESAKFLY